MTRVSIHRYATKVTGGKSALGSLLGHHVLKMQAVPRVGEIITHHPDGKPSENSWTAVVTGIQHVVSVSHVTERSGQFIEPLHLTNVCVTVRDERVVDPPGQTEPGAVQRET